MSNGLPAITSILTGAGIGFLGGSLLGNSALKSANSAFSAQLAAQNRALGIQIDQERAEQESSLRLMQNQLQTDQARATRSMASYLAGGSVGQPLATGNNVRSLLGPVG